MTPQAAADVHQAAFAAGTPCGGSVLALTSHGSAGAGPQSIAAVTPQVAAAMMSQGSAGATHENTVTAGSQTVEAATPKPSVNGGSAAAANLEPVAVEALLPALRSRLLYEKVGNRREPRENG